MTLTNAYFRGISNVLTPDPQLQYITVDLKKKTGYRTDTKPENFKVINIFKLLNEKIPARSNERRTISISECQERLELLTEIKSLCNVIYHKYVTNMNSTRRKVFTFASKDYESERSLSLIDTENMLTQLTKTITSIQSKVSDELHLANLRKVAIQSITSFTSKAIDELSTEELLSYTTITFELATQVGMEFWAKTNSKLIHYLYDQIIVNIRNGNIASEDITYIADASEKLTSILSL